jgi:transposase
MDRKASDSIVTAIGIDIGKNTFHLVGQDERGTIVLRQKLSRGQVTARLANCAVSDWHGGLRRRPSSEP